MPPPTLSIIMSVFNAETYVEEVIKSILSQSFTSFELIVVDDGSTDGSMEAFLLHILQQNHRLHIYNPHQLKKVVKNRWFKIGAYCIRPSAKHAHTIRPSYCIRPWWLNHKMVYAFVRSPLIWR